MTTVAVIPARHASTRFPGKPLAKETGKFLVQHVYERVAESSRIDRVIVATDDQRIIEAVNSFGGESCRTRADHTSGTDRVAEAVSALGLAADDLVLNVQGDEPEIEVEVLDRLIERAGSDCDRIRIATLAAPFREDGPSEGPESPLDPNCVKVVVDEKRQALYFSRSLVPYPQDTGGAVDRPSRWLLHLGVYAFRADTLGAVSAGGTRESALEGAESLEQLRWMERGFAIGVEIVAHGFAGIDTREDYAAFVARVGNPIRNVEIKT